MLMVTELMGQWSVWSLFKYIHVDIHWSYFKFCYQGNMYTKYHTHQAAGREVDAWHWDVISMTYRKLNVRSPLNRRRKMKMRAERKKDKEMMISRGGATEAAITRKALLVHPTLSLGGYLWLCSPPPFFFLHITPHPPLPVTRTSVSQDSPTGEAMTADYGTSMSEAAIMRNLGFGRGLWVLDRTQG